MPEDVDFSTESDTCITTLFEWVQFIRTILLIEQEKDSVQKAELYHSLVLRVQTNMKDFGGRLEDLEVYEEMISDIMKERGIETQPLNGDTP